MATPPVTPPKPPPPPTLERANQLGTAAELLHYSSYTKKGTTDIAWTRWSSANENFEIAQSSGKKFLIVFDKNFSKKHLVTFSKKEAETKKRAETIGKANSKNTPEQNLALAQNELLAEKILDVLAVRGSKEDGDCLNCTHPKANVPDGTGHNSSGVCKISGCTCPKYKGRTAYEVGRDTKGKPDLNPLAGATTKKSTVLVLNRIPLSEFIDVVAKSIEAVDKDDKLAANTDVHLKWDFGSKRAGAILYAQNGAMVSDPPIRTWVEVSAKKMPSAPTGITSSWQVFHWNADGA